MSEEVKAKESAYKHITLNCLERETVLATMLEVFKGGVGGNTVYWMTRTDDSLGLDQIVEWRMTRDELLNKKIAEYKKDPSKTVALSKEENAGKDKEIKIAITVFKFMQDFLKKRDNYPISLRTIVSDIHKKFEITYDKEQKEEAKS